MSPNAICHVENTAITSNTIKYASLPVHKLKKQNTTDACSWPLCISTCTRTVIEKLRSALDSQTLRRLAQTIIQYCKKNQNALFRFCSLAQWDPTKSEGRIVAFSPFSKVPLESVQARTSKQQLVFCFVFWELVSFSNMREYRDRKKEELKQWELVRSRSKRKKPKKMILLRYPRPVSESQRENRSVFRWDDHHRVTSLWPPHQHLGVVGIGLDHGVGGDGLILSQNLWLYLGHGLFQNGPLTQRLLRVHFYVKPHPPADRLQDQRLWGGLIDGHEPSREALVAEDAAELRHIAVADGHSPGHAGVKIVIHTDYEFAVLLGGAYDGAGFSSVSVPRVVDAVWVADGLDLAVTQIREFPTWPGSWKEAQMRIHRHRSFIENHLFLKGKLDVSTCKMLYNNA